MTSPILVLFRKDLRLADNGAFSAACAAGRPIVPVYIREPAERRTGALGAAQAWWLHHSLSALIKALGAAGSRLLLRSGETEEVVFKLLAETGADTVYWNRRYEPRGVAIDSDLKARLAERGIKVRSFAGHLLHEPSQLKTSQGGHFKVFSPFWRALSAGDGPPAPLDAPVVVPAPQTWPHSEALDDYRLLPAAPNWASAFAEMWEPGEAGAMRRLEKFLATGLSRYKACRDQPGTEATSMLSPHLALGEIAPARVWHAVSGQGAADGADIVKFRQELAWRDFSYHLLFHFPALERQNWNGRFDDFAWVEPGDAFKAWTRGMTGYPIVDAGMRELWRHGIMHNRVRMIAASFLIKDLLVDWRKGEAWFRDTLVDADPASNPASWQWVAGTGADAAPYFRIFNPILQGEKFDPDGRYVRRYVPELAALPDKFLHRPFEAPAPVLKAAGVRLGETYPLPIVDHAQARQRALRAFKATETG